MKLIHKNNIWTIFCQAFTIVALAGMVLDVTWKKSMNYSQFNLLMIAFCCAITILILSQTYHLEFLSPLVIIIIQYITATAAIGVLVRISSFWDPVAPHGYRDAFVTFSIPYAIGEMIYWNIRKKEIRRQNEDLQMIKKFREVEG